MQLNRLARLVRADKSARNDRGFTLVELIVTVAIIGIITVPLVNIVIVYLLNTATASARINESHDEQIAAAYWQQDVSSTGIRGDYDPASHTFPLQQSVNTPFPCTIPGGSNLLVTLAWNQYDSAGGATRVTVAYVTTGTKLARLHCIGATLDSTLTMAHYLSQDLSQAPTITCAGSAGPICNGSGTAVPTSVSLTLHIKYGDANGQPYPVVLSGQRRQT